MDYKTKIKYTNLAVDQILNHKSIDEIKSDLLAKDGVYEYDVYRIIFSAKEIIKKQYQPKIHEYLLNDKSIHGSQEFSMLDKEIIDPLIEQEVKSLAVKEKRKIAKSIKAGRTEKEVYDDVDTRFLHPNEAKDHMADLQAVKNLSNKNRRISIFWGIGLILSFFLILITTDRIYYLLPILGFIRIIRGLMTEKIEYE